MCDEATMFNQVLYVNQKNCVIYLAGVTMFDQI